jgi:hypothetical protein
MLPELAVIRRFKRRSSALLFVHDRPSAATLKN